MRTWWTTIGLCVFIYLVGFSTGVMNSGGWSLIIDPAIFIISFVGGAGLMVRFYRRKEARKWEHGIDAAKWTHQEVESE